MLLSGLTFQQVFFACSAMLCFVCLFMYLSQKKPLTLRSGLFVLMLCNILATALVSVFIISVLSDVSMESDSWGYVETLEEIYFGVHTLLAPMFAYYILLINNPGRNPSKIFSSLFFLPAVVADVMVVTNRFTGLMFIVDDGKFTRGKYEIVLYILAAAYLLFCISDILYHIKYLTINERIGLMGALTLIFVGVVIQLIEPSLQVEIWFEALTIPLMMKLLENYDRIYDNHKIAYNREYFIDFNNKLIATKHAYAIVVVALSNVRNYTAHMDELTSGAFKYESAKFLKKNCSEGDVFELRNNLFAYATFYRGRKLETIVENIADAYRNGMMFGEKRVNLEVAIASAKIPDELNSSFEILDFADLVAKESPNGVKVIGQEMIDTVRKHFDIEGAVRRAIKNQSFEVYYQPIWDAETGRIKWAEALCRLIDDELGFISPADFIPVAEKRGLIVDLDEIVFDKVCSFLCYCKPKNYGLEYIEVNISPYQLMMKDMPDRLKAIMDKFNVDFSMINLEITESTELYDDEVTNQNINKLIDMNAKFSLDDFGTGYSNISFILKKKFENIKIDKSLLWDANNPASREMLLSFVKSFKKMGTKIIQEGVENKSQLKFIVEAGATKIQGYYFSKPLPEDQFMKCLKDYNLDGVTPDVSGIVSEKANEYKEKFGSMEEV